MKRVDALKNLLFGTRPRLGATRDTLSSQSSATTRHDLYIKAEQDMRCEAQRWNQFAFDSRGRVATSLTSMLLANPLMLTSAMLCQTSPPLQLGFAIAGLSVLGAGLSCALINWARQKSARAVERALQPCVEALHQQKWRVLSQPNGPPVSEDFEILRHLTRRPTS
jgi:hypothetical protein